MDNRFYVPGAGWDLLSKTLRNIKDGDNITDEYYAIILDYVVLKEGEKVRYYARMIQPCDSTYKGTPHDFCVNPFDVDSNMFLYYTRQHTKLDVNRSESNSFRGLLKGVIVKIKLNKKTYLNKTYVDTTTATLLEVYDDTTSFNMFPTFSNSETIKKVRSIEKNLQKNLTSATTISNYTVATPTEVKCFNLGNTQLFNGFMPDDLIQTVEDYCKGEGVQCSENVVDRDKNGKPVRLYKEIMPDYIKFCDTYYDLVTKRYSRLKLIINQSYRSLQDQIEIAVKEPAKAAPPGTSLHSWGTAIDIGNTGYRLVNGEVRQIVSTEQEIKQMATTLSIDLDSIDKNTKQYKKIIEKITNAIQYRDSLVRQLLEGNTGRFSNPFNVRSSLPESWHFQVNVEDAFGNVDIIKCPTPGTQPQVENTTGSKAGDAEEKVGEAEPSENGANDADTSGSTTEQTPAVAET